MTITDNWIQFAVRFIVKTHDIRAVKDAISRDLMDSLDAVGIGIASGTYDIVGLPPIHVDMQQGAPQESAADRKVKQDQAAAKRQASAPNAASADVKKSEESKKTEEAKQLQPEEDA
jgi:hypothetical protein